MKVKERELRQLQGSLMKLFTTQADRLSENVSKVLTELPIEERRICDLINTRVNMYDEVMCPECYTQLTIYNDDEATFKVRGRSVVMGARKCYMCGEEAFYWKRFSKDIETREYVNGYRIGSDNKKRLKKREEYERRLLRNKKLKSRLPVKTYTKANQMRGMLSGQ